MTARDQLADLQRLFPRASELAVSRELAEAYEAELVKATRYTHIVTEPLSWFPVETFPTGLKARKLPLLFRAARLTEVWH